MVAQATRIQDHPPVYDAMGEEGPIDDGALQTYLADLAEYNHLSLMTYRESGVLVPTILWLAPYSGRLVGFVGEQSSTAQRIVEGLVGQLAPCDTHGNLLSDPLAVRVRVMTAAETPVVREALYEKYRWLYRLSAIKGRLERVLRIRIDNPIGVEITTDAALYVEPPIGRAAGL